MSKKTGKLIYEVELNVSGVEKHGRQVNKVIRDMRNEMKELTKNEKEAGASVESKSQKLEHSQKTIKALKDEYEIAAVALEKFKQESGEATEYSEAQNQIITKLTSNMTKLQTEIAKTERSQEAFTISHQKELDKQTRAQEKQIDSLKKKRSEAYKDIGTGMDTTANYAVAGAGAVLGGIAYATKSYLDYEAQEINVMRLVKGDEENKQVIKDELRSLDISMHEDTNELLSAAEVLIKQLDPDKYATKFSEAMKETMDFALAADLDSGTAMDLTVAVATLLGKPIEDMNHTFSGLNAIQNEYGTDLAASAQMFTQLLPQALNSGYNQDNAIAMSGLMSIVSQKGEAADARSMGELLDIFSQVRYATPGIESFGRIIQGMGYMADSKGFESFKADNPEKFKELLEKTGVSLAQFDKELAMFEIKEDAMKATGITNLSELQQYADENPFEMMLKMLEYFVEQAGDGLVNEYLSSKSYLSGNSNTQLALANLMSNPEMLRQMSEMSTSANLTGDANQLEASEIRDTDGNKLRVAWKSVEKFIEDIGAELSPVIVTMVESLEPWKETLKDLSGRLQEMDPDEIRGWIELVLKVFAGGTLTRFVTNFGRDINDVYKMFKGFGTVGKTTWGLFKQKDAFGTVTELLKNAKGASETAKTIGSGKEMVGVFTGLKGGFAGLKTTMVGSIGSLSTLALTLGAVTAVSAGALYLEHQANEARKRQIDFERDRKNVVDSKTRADMYEDTEQGKGVRVKLQSRLSGGISVDLDSSDYLELEQQLESYVKRIDESGEVLIQTLSETGASNETVKGVKTIMDNTNTKQAEITAYIEQLKNQETQATKAQLGELEQMYKSMDDLYTQMQAQTDEEYAQLKQSINTRNTGKNLSYGERTDLIASGSENIRNLENARELELTNLSKQLADEVITREEYNEKSKQYNKEIDNTIAQVIAQQEGLAQSNSWFEGIFKYNIFNDTRNQVKGDAEKYDIDQAQYGSAFNEAERVVGGKISLVGLDAEQVMIANNYVESVKELTTTREGLDSITYGFEQLAFAMNYVGGEGVSKLSDLWLIKDSLPTKYVEDLKLEVFNYVQALDYAQVMSLEGLQMLIYSNTSEEMDKFMSLHGLWDNSEFITQFMQIDTNAPDAEERVYELMSTVGQVDPETVLTFKDNTQQPLVNIQSLQQAIANLPKNTEVHIWETTHQRIVQEGNIADSKRKPYNKFGITPMYAKGTGYHFGGPAILGDGGEHELVIEPGRAPWVSGNQTEFVKHLARGSAVIPFSKLPAYAEGTTKSFLDSFKTTQSSVIGDTYNHAITINAYTDNVDVGLIQREISKTMRNEELNRRRVKASGGES